jgi:hypothetical protein
MSNLYESKTVGTDGLLYDLNPAPEAFFVTIKAGAGSLKRGTILAMGDDGMVDTLDGSDGMPSCILCDDTEVGDADVKALAYCRGHFAAEKLHFAEGIPVPDEVKNALRYAGILVSNAIEM